MTQSSEPETEVVDSGGGGPIDRRRFVTAVAGGAAAAVLATAASVSAQPRPPRPAALLAAPATKTIVPLPFSPASLTGLSERLLTSHHDNNYAGAVRKLNEIRTQLGTADPATSGGYWSMYGTLRAAELAARNSAQLHELYFANLAAGQAVPARLAAMIAQRFGSTDRFQAQLFGAASASNGWVVLVADVTSRTLELVQTDGHAFGAWEAAPLLVLDMFEHAYALDYGANKRGYLDAFFRNVAWTEVDARAHRAIARM